MRSIIWFNWPAQHLSFLWSIFICDSQESLLSIVTPRNLVSLTSSISLPNILSGILSVQLSIFWPLGKKCIKQVFSSLICNLFAWVYLHTASRIVLALLAASLYVFPETNIFVSSAKRTSWLGHFRPACFTFFAGPHYNIFWPPQMPRLTNYIKNLCIKPFWNYEGGNTYVTFWLNFSCYYCWNVPYKSREQNFKLSLFKYLIS